MKKFLSIVMLVSLLTNEISAINFSDISQKTVELGQRTKDAVLSVGQKAVEAGQITKDCTYSLMSNVKDVFVSTYQKAGNLGINALEKTKDHSKNALEATKTLASDIGKDTCNFVSEHKYGVAAAGVGLLSVCVYRYLSNMEKVRQSEIARQAEIARELN